MDHWLIFGGTFDPIHYGHLIVAQAARELLDADGVILVPAFVSPHKVDGKSAAGSDRLEMARLATHGIKEFRVYAGEIERGGTSFTIDTITALKRENPTSRFTLLIGADQLPMLHTWHKIDQILSSIGVGVLARPNSQIPVDVLEQTLGPAATRQLTAAVLRTPLIEISATAIRGRMAAGKSIHFLLPSAVEEYVRSRRLYQ